MPFDLLGMQMSCGGMVLWDVGANPYCGTT